MRKLSVGGQALIEGVMMKSEEKKAIAIRKSNGEIVLKTENIKSAGNKLRKVPFVRGVFMLIDSMVQGSKDINYSASFFEEEEEVDGFFENLMTKIFKENADKVATVISMVIAVALALGLFVILPSFVVSFSESDTGALKSLKEGIIKVGFFVAYIYLISLLSDIKRVFQYHGAEHKSIQAYERDLELTVENVKKMPRLHPRCGTNFIFVVLMVSTFIFSFISTESILLRSLLKVIMLPIVSGISYEIIKLAGKGNDPFTKALVFPGLMLQKITTKEPDERQIEVAIASLKGALGINETKEDMKEDAQEVFLLNQDILEREKTFAAAIANNGAGE
ncbi:uncharacterized protein YqhQ [Acetoanaerobium pronyense]|uniref:Uncharacterized protein YqhQ n=1 Tax=Acetoanaerobium pronyense TaxID=1482736 RepID=A0ABS4KJN8_9FIRM|nr:DUF1385 domain-containing protein [Acetoanaerobium pronyense]MBP2027997.1 uncharacterized protein YqhQ [Acetoanaerobium pronyense]